MAEDEPIGVREAARMLGVHENTIRNWITAGRLESVKYGGRFRRLSRRQVERMVQRLPELPDYLPDVDAAYERGRRDGRRGALHDMRVALSELETEPQTIEPEEEPAD